VSEIGNLLRSAREKKNVSVDEVARATRIKATYLEALENDEYSVLPGPAYITGFLRNYASYLGLHPDDVVQEYYAVRPLPQPSVRAATRVLADGYHRYNRTRILSALAGLVLILVGGYAVKQYNDTYAHPYSPQIRITPANLGAPSPPLQTQHQVVAGVFRLRLQALMPVWVRVTVDGQRAFEGILRPRFPHAAWRAHRSVFVATYDGPHLRALYNGHPIGVMSARSGLIVATPTRTGWRQVS